MFDFDELDRLDMKAYRGISAIKLKAMAMKLRHKVQGYRFTREERRASIGKSHEALGLAEPLHSAEQGANEPKDAAPRPTTTSCEAILGSDNILGLKGIFFHPFCALLVCVPLGILSPTMGFGDTWTFFLNFLALVPLAKILGDATEELAACIGSDTISGLLNATFGNAVEMIISVQSIRAGLFNVVKASLLGSILSNILLVLGSSFLLGGLSLSKKKRGKYHTFRGNSEHWRRRLIGLEKEQKFPVKTALISLAMLLFASMTAVLPTLFGLMPSPDDTRILKLSRIGSWITVSSYVLYLIFQLLTHSLTISSEENMEHTRSRAETSMSAEAFPEVEEEEEADESASLDMWVAITLMALTTVVVSINSELLVQTIEEVVKGCGIPIGFIGVILLPIAGNACEHASALRFSLRDRPGLAIGIAVGSSTQVALLVVPASVLIAQLMGQPLDLDFGVLNAGVMTFSFLVVLVLLLDGRSNWFKGYVLVAMYVFLAFCYWYIPPEFGRTLRVPVYFV